MGKIPNTMIHTIKVNCRSCGEEKVFTAVTQTKRKTKSLSEAAMNSKCWLCGGK